MNRYRSLIMLIPKLGNRVTMAPRVPTAFGLLVLLPAALILSCQHQPQPGKTVAPSPTPTPAPVVMMYPPGFGPAVLGKPYPGTGIVTIVNRQEGWVEIEHEEIKDLMPAMTMEFWVRKPNRSIMKGVRVGDKVDFVVVEDSKGEYLTELKKVAPGR
jgi:Cu/Ag efflux protein CusF